MLFDERVLVTLISVELSPVLADEIILEVALISVVFLDLLTRKVHYFEVGEGGSQVHHAPGQREKGHIDFIVFETVLAHDWHSDITAWTVCSLVVVLFCWLSILVINREIGRQLNFSPDDLRLFPRR